MDNRHLKWVNAYKTLFTGIYDNDDDYDKSAFTANCA